MNVFLDCDLSEWAMVMCVCTRVNGHELEQEMKASHRYLFDVRRLIQLRAINVRVRAIAFLVPSCLRPPKSVYVMHTKIKYIAFEINVFDPITRTPNPLLSVCVCARCTTKYGNFISSATIILVAVIRFEISQHKTCSACTICRQVD